MSNFKEKTGHIVALDTFRAWAILSVLLFHYFKEFFPGRASFLRFGWSGVDLFFVISGFVMYLQIARKYAAEGKIHFRKYFRNRFLRIVPAFYASLIAEVVILHRDKLFSKEFLMHLSFTHVLSYRVAFSIQPIYWSLAIEVQFYVFLILVAGLLMKRTGPLFLVLLMALSILYRFIVSEASGFSHTGILLINQLPGRLPQFICGMFLAIAYREPDFWRSLQKKVPFVFLGGIIMYIFCGFFWLRGGDRIFDNVLIETAFHPLLGISFALIMTSLVGLQGKAGAVMRFRPLVFIGLISYSLYLWHFFLLEVVNDVGIRGTVSSGIMMPVTLVCALLLSTLSYYLIEKQFLKLKA
jgi:peptidoglycan/LPS O-acetylase OafA/YrhL